VGRKRHIVVDTLGLVGDGLITPACVQDRVAGAHLIDQVRPRQLTMEQLWADGAYNGGFLRHARRKGWSVEIVRRSDDRQHGRWRDGQLPLIKVRPRFDLVRWRWIVERTFAWFGRYRRLSKDHEQLTGVSLAMLWVVGCRLLVQRLAYC